MTVRSRRYDADKLDLEAYQRSWKALGIDEDIDWNPEDEDEESEEDDCPSTHCYSPPTPQTLSNTTAKPMK